MKFPGINIHVYSTGCGFTEKLLMTIYIFQYIFILLVFDAFLADSKADEVAVAVYTGASTAAEEKKTSTFSLVYIYLSINEYTHQSTAKYIHSPFADSLEAIFPEG